MRKFICLFVVILLSVTWVSAQNFISINPNSGIKGQTINTTVTSSGFFFTSGSAPGTWVNDFFMQQGNYFIYPTNINIINDDLLDADWNIPLNAPIGNYNVRWDISGFGMVYFDVPGGFTIADGFVSGNVFNDLDSSGTFNGSEYGLGNRTILLLPDSFYTVTNLNGDYMLLSTLGNKTVEVTPSLLWNNTTTSPQQITVSGISTTGVDFGLKAAVTIYDIDANLTIGVMPRCFTTVPIIISYVNNGTVTTQGEVTFYMSANCTFVSSSITPDNILGNAYTWNYTNLLPGESRNIIFYMALPGPATVSNNHVIVTARNDQNVVVDIDEAILNFTVICAYDPNDKSVTPPGEQSPFNYTLMSDSLDFLIRFQNTGNDTAFKVVIIDTLDLSILDINTFQLITNSHPLVTDLRANGVITFTFDNILLPDSIVDEPGSHGYVKFRFLIKDSLPNNTVLNNTAHIFFDFNPAIVTNTTLNTLVYQIPVGISEPDALNVVTVMPNPFSNDPVMLFYNPDNAKFILTIFSIDGKRVSQQEVIGSAVTIPSEKLQKGIYLYKLTHENETRIHYGKFVKM